MPGITYSCKVARGIAKQHACIARRYDDLKSAGENIELQTTILSRFDLIFIVKDERNAARDRQIAKCAPSVHLPWALFYPPAMQPMPQTAAKFCMPSCLLELQQPHIMRHAQPRSVAPLL